jgi:cystathionine beta-lyase/cystathionine gamma-synthase
MKFETKAIHAGQEPDGGTGATVIPIHLTTTFTQHEIGGTPPWEYSRTGNPTRHALESCLAAHDEGSYGLAFSSGSAASAAVLSILSPGDHVVSSEDVYGGTRRLFEHVLRPAGIDFTYVDGRNPADFAGAFRPETRLVWIETPSNPLLHLTDIEAVADLARARGIPVVVDNTFASPWLQQPLRLGADVVVYSTTKYINGHSDAVGGAVVTSSDRIHERVRFYQNAAGAVPGPFESWLTLRGAKTLAVRMNRHGENAMQVAEFLSYRPAISRLVYPGLKTHPQHDLARRQMRGFGGMLTIDLRGGVEAAQLFVSRLKIFSFAESLGGVESLVCHPETMTHASIPAAERRRRGISPGTIRISVGIEDPADLTADLEQALEGL